MSLTVKVKQFQVGKCKGDKFVRVEFRGKFYYVFIIIIFIIACFKAIIYGLPST